LIDYAGLFPPAAHALPEAVANFREYLNRPERWMLSRFILTAVHLEQCSEELLALFSDKDSLDISLVVRDPHKDVPNAQKRLQALAGRVSLGCLEVALDPKRDVSQQLSSIESLLSAVDQPGAKIPVFYEVPLCDDWPSVFGRLTDQLVSARSGAARNLGFKLRCGGVEKQLIPSPERVARAIHTCAAKGIPIKFTAGLHQPFRHVDQLDIKSGDIAMHGYFNIFYAALLANTVQASLAELIAVVSEMHSLRPDVDRDGIRWLGHEVSTRDIEAARSGRVISYGSCSFEEPLQAARDLGWL
jgi:hypothetical protein